MTSQSHPQRPGKAPAEPELSGVPVPEAFDRIDAYLTMLDAHYTALDAWLRAKAREVPRG